MRLGIDLDGVVADFTAGWMRLHADEFGSELQPEMVTTWNGLHEVGGFATMGDFWAWARPQDHRRSIFRHLDPYPGAVDALRRLRQRGHRIVIVTTKPHWAHTDTLHWLADHELPTAEIHMTDHKSDVDCDVYLDDAPHVLEELLANRPNSLVVRYIRPWNVALPRAADATNWEDFERIVAERADS